MLSLDRATVAHHLPYARLIAALRTGLPMPIVTPARAHHTVAPPDNLLLIMPSWRVGDLVGVKLTSVFPSNTALGMPMIHGLYTLIDGQTGVPQAVMNGTELTLRRTAALAALATERLAAHIGGYLLVMGTGALSTAMIEAHLSLGNWQRISVWGRTPEKAQAVASHFAAQGVSVNVAEGAKAAVCEADVICCVTAASEPILENAWIRDGTHVNLFGAYLPTMREADSDLIARAFLYVDDREAAKHEAGDILIPLKEGRIMPTHIRGEIRDLLIVRPAHTADTVTVLKSVGFGALDLIAAELALAGVRAPNIEALAT